MYIYMYMSIKDHFMNHFTPNNSEQLVKVLVGFVHWNEAPSPMFLDGKTEDPEKTMKRNTYPP